MSTKICAVSNDYFNFKMIYNLHHNICICENISGGLNKLNKIFGYQVFQSQKSNRNKSVG